MAKERLEVEITADDKASKVIDPLKKKVTDLDKTTTTVTVEGDTKAADRDIDSFAKRLEQLTTSDQIVLLSLKAGAAQSELTDLATDIARLDGSDPEIDVKVARYNELTGELDQIENKIRGIADADPDAKQHLQQASSKLERMGVESGKAGDAVHSMAGNAIGDLAATAAGVGPVGEAIGQLTEGVLGGEIAFKQLAKAALSIGAITAGVLFINNVIGTYRKEAEAAAKVEAFNVKNAEEFAKWATEGKDAVAEYTNQAREAGKIEVAPDVDDFNKAFDTMGLLNGSLSDVSANMREVGKLELHGVKDMTKDFEDAHVSAQEFFEAAAPGNQAGFTALVDKIKGSQVPLKQQATLIAALVYQQDQFATGAQDAATRLAVFGTEVKGTTRDMTPAIKALDQFGQNLTKAVEGAQDYIDATSGQDWGAAAFSGAETAMSTFTDQHFALKNIAAANEEAIDNFTDSVKKNTLTFDLNTEAGRANQKALEDVASSLDVQFAGAYKDANGNLDTFKQKATTIAQQTLTRLQTELGLSDEQTADLATSLGLLPDDIETRFKLSGDAEAQLKLQLLQGVIDGLPDEVQTEVAMNVLAGDPQAAVAAVQTYMDHNPVVGEIVWKNVGLAAAIGAAAGAAKITGVQSAKGRYVPAGANLLTTVAEPGAGPEVILPLNDPDRMRQILAQAGAAQKVLAALGAPTGENGPELVTRTTGRILA